MYKLLIITLKSIDHEWIITYSAIMYTYHNNITIDKYIAIVYMFNINHIQLPIICNS